MISPRGANTEVDLTYHTAGPTEQGYVLLYWTIVENNTIITVTLYC